MRRWDFLHCPAGVEHVFVGAGDSQCAMLMIGSRRLDEAHYPVNDLAAKYGASVQTATDVPDEAYPDWRNEARTEVANTTRGPGTRGERPAHPVRDAPVPRS